jgi:NHL repeat-containing protein
MMTVSGRLILLAVVTLSLFASAPGAHLAAQTAPRPAAPLTGVPAFEPDPKWPVLPADWSWGQVIGIFADSRGHVWTSNRSRITEWDPQGKLVQSWDARGPDGNWSTIHGLFVDHNGFVWTNARESQLTIKFTRTGQVSMVIGKFNETGGSNDTTLMGRPAEIWVDPADNEVFIADGYGNRRIIVFDGATGRYLRHWGAYGKRPEDPPRRGGGNAGTAAGAGGGRGDTAGRGAAGGATAAAGGATGAGGGATGAGGGSTAAAGGAAGGGRGAQDTTVPPAPPQQFSVPHGITGSRDGLIYLADRANNRIQVFRQNGEFVKEKILRPRCGPQEQATWTPKRPCGTEAAFSVGFSHDAPQTYVYVADGGSHFITVLRRGDLEVLSEFGGPGVGPGQLGRPHNLSVDPSGNIFVAEAAGPQVKHPTTGENVEAGFRAQKFTFKGMKD